MLGLFWIQTVGISEFFFFLEKVDFEKISRRHLTFDTPEASSKTRALASARCTGVRLYT